MGMMSGRLACTKATRPTEFRVRTDSHSARERTRNCGFPARSVMLAPSQRDGLSAASGYAVVPSLARGDGGRRVVQCLITQPRGPSWSLHELRAREVRMSPEILPAPVSPPAPSPAKAPRVEYVDFQDVAEHREFRFR